MEVALGVLIGLTLVALPLSMVVAVLVRLRREAESRVFDHEIDRLLEEEGGGC